MRIPAGRRRTRLVTVFAVMSLAGVGGAGPRAAAGSTAPLPGVMQPAMAAGPTVSGPVTGGLGHPFGASSLDLPAAGYTEQEYFVDGIATAYASTGPLTSDGRWTATPAATANYRTRIIVRRPSAARFNGTVIVEWLNVTAGFDNGPDWGYAANELMRAGFAWVGVSAQAVGVNGLPPTSPLGNHNALKNVDPARYGSLLHPGDSFSYDIFSQAGQSLRRPNGVDPMGGLVVKKLIADGESQSAGRMVTYVDAVQPVAGVYDGFLIHSRSAGASALSQAPQPSITAPSPTFIRSDLNVPVLVFETETDVTGHFAARQADSSTYRLWEAAGTAHADGYDVGRGVQDGLRFSLASNVLQPCSEPLNNGPGHYLVAAAMDALNRWVNGGAPPAIAPRITIVAGSPNRILRDPLGNALGGIRTSRMDAPTATLSGEPAPGPIFCSLFGSSVPLPPQTLVGLYHTRSAYLNAVNASTDSSVAAGFVLPADGATMKSDAAEDAFAFGDAAFAGSTGSLNLHAPMRGVATTPSGKGYYLVAGDGGVFTFGDAVFRGSLAGQPLRAPVVGIAADPLGRGYWLAAADGSVAAFGAPAFGSAASLHLNGPIVGVTPTPTGKGYWLVAADGGVFAYGDARFAGSAATLRLAQPVVGMATAPGGAGYWLVGADGGVFSFNSPFLGSSTAATALGDPMVGIAATPGAGYRLLTRGGRVDSFGDATTIGDLLASGRDATGIASTPTGEGFYLVVSRPF